jgi:hypothetical protein
MPSYRFRCGHKGLWGGPIHVNGRQYQINAEGYCDVDNELDALRLQKTPGWELRPIVLPQAAEAIVTAAPLEPQIAQSQPARQVGRRPVKAGG